PRSRWSGARVRVVEGVLPRYGLDRRQAAGQQGLLLPRRVGAGRRQAAHRLAALPRPRRGDRRSSLAVRAGRASPHPPPRLRRPRRGVVEIVDEVVGQRRADAACSVGTYIALAAANRVVEPCSKRAFSEWWA